MQTRLNQPPKPLIKYTNYAYYAFYIAYFYAARWKS